jgi:ABC-type molybdate transport system permease subunit
MLEAILTTLKIMGWLGVVLALVVIVNTVCGTVFNISSKKESFSWKRLLKGLGKSLVFYLSATLMGVACTMLPYINEMITGAFGTVLLSNDILTTLSSVGVLGVVVAAIVSLGKKAIANVVKLANMAYETEEITWNVEEE